jgi:hypothetical protein
LELHQVLVIEMKKIKLDVFLLDKHRVIPIKAVYDPESRLASTKKGLRGSISKFHVDPDHIYLMRKGLTEKNIIFVDNALRCSVKTQLPVTTYNPDGSKKTEMKEVDVSANPSVKMHSEDEIDHLEATSLDILTEKSFWKSLIEKRKIPTLTVLTFLLAGMGLYHLILVILRVFGFNV